MRRDVFSAPGGQRGIDKLKQGCIASRRDGDAQRLLRSISLEVGLEPVAQTAGMGADNVVVTGVIAGGTLEDGFADVSLAQAGALSAERLPADLEQKSGEPVGVREAGTGRHALSKKPARIVLIGTVQVISSLVTHIQNHGMARAPPGQVR